MGGADVDSAGPATPRVVVVGAGPAGVRCAETLVKAGIRPVVVDEGRRSGGQIYRRQPENFTRPYAALYGSEAAKAESIHRTFDSLLEHIDYMPETLIWNIADNHVYTVCGNRQRALAYDALILCTGATDRLMPVKGWQLAGTFSLGGAQVALKSQACAVGSRVVFMGTGALLYLVAAQYAAAGATVAAVLDTSALWRRVAALPKLLAQPRALWKGMLLTASLYRARVPVYFGIRPVAIEGSDDSGVAAVSFRDSMGKTRTLACDAVAMGYHLRPENQLADLARCEFRFDQPTRQWLPLADRDGRSSIDDVYLAGDGARILGADGAEASGELAALAALEDSGARVDSSRMDSLRRKLVKLQRFARGLNQAFPWPAAFAAELVDDTIVCRCEAIRVGELRATLSVTGSREVNRTKAFSRVGMGRCQGRYCGNAAAEIIASDGGVAIEEAGRLRAQAPVKPLPVALEKDS